MKNYRFKLMFICFFYLLNLTINGQNLKGEIRKELFRFLIMNSANKQDTLLINRTRIKYPNLMIIEVINKKEIKKNYIYYLDNGMYLFGTFNPHWYKHFLFCYKNKKVIINMKRPLKDILNEVDVILINTKFTQTEKNIFTNEIKRVHYINWLNNGEYHFDNYNDKFY